MTVDHIWDWYSYTDIPEDYFFNMCAESHWDEQPEKLINIVDEISTLQRLTRHGEEQFDRPTYTTIASLYSLFKKGYVFLTIGGNKDKDKRLYKILICPDEFTKQVINTDGPVTIHYNFSHRLTKLEDSYPYFYLASQITEEGKNWLKDMESKYPELFKSQVEIKPILHKTFRQKPYSVPIPDNPSKSGTWSWDPKIYTEE